MTINAQTDRPYGQWKELYHEVVSTNLCTGCAACIMACPRSSTSEKIEIPLKEYHPLTREGCKLCPDFAAEHADISTGGLGQSDGWTLTIVRTERGAEWMRGLEEAGWIRTRPGSEDPKALELLRKLASKQRKRIAVTVP